MPEEISREESFKALLGLVLARSDRYSAEIVQRLQSDEERQVALNQVLFNACSFGEAIATELAIMAGAEVNRKDSLYSPVGQATLGDHLECLRLVLKHGADVNTSHKYGYTPLHWAARAGHHKCLKLLLEYGADVNAENLRGETPASSAAMIGHLDCLKILLENGAKINAFDRKGRSLRDVAKSSEKHDSVNLIDDWIAAYPECNS